MRLGSKRYILIYLGAIFLMSHIICNNVGAVSTVIDLSSYDLVYVNEEPPFNCNYSTGEWVRGVRVCELAHSNDSSNGQSRVLMRTIATSVDFPHKTGDIVTFDLVFYQDSIVGLTQGLEFRTYYPGNNNVLLDFNLNDSSMYSNSAMGTYAPIEGYNVSRIYNVSYLSLNDATKVIGFATGSGNFIYYQPSVEQNVEGLVNTRVLVRIQNVKIYRLNGNKINEEQAQATQDAADNSEAAAEDNSEDAATTNLIGAFSSLLSALTSLNATNCNVTLPFPSALGGNMTVNICQNKDYAGNIISVFGSLTLCVFYVPLALKLLSMIYNEIRSFTNG